MVNEQNLMPIEEVNSRRTPEQYSIDSRKAGIASGEARRKRKKFAEQMNLLMSLPVKDMKGKDILKSLGIDDENADNQMLLIVSQFRKAMKGDMDAFKLFQNTLEPPAENEGGVFGEIEDTSETDAMIYGEDSYSSLLHSDMI